MVKMEIMFDTMAQPVLLFSPLQSVRLPRCWPVQAVGGGGGVRGGEGGLGPLLPAPGARLHRPGPGRVCGRQVRKLNPTPTPTLYFDIPGKTPSPCGPWQPTPRQ